MKIPVLKGEKLFAHWSVAQQDDRATAYRINMRNDGYVTFRIDVSAVPERPRSSAPVIIALVVG